MLKNINKKMKEIDSEINTILAAKKQNKTQDITTLLKKLYLNIGLSNIYLTNLINFDLKKAALEKRRTSKVFYYTFAISLFFIVIIFIVSILSSVFIIDNFKELHNSLEKKVDEKTKELQQLNKNLEIRIKKEVENNRKCFKT